MMEAANESKIDVETFVGHTNVTWSRPSNVDIALSSKPKQVADKEHCQWQLMEPEGECSGSYVRDEVVY